MALKEIVRNQMECAVNFTGNLLVHLLEVRIPTALSLLSEEQSRKIMLAVRPGDIILTADASYLLWETIEYAVAGSHFTHCMIYEGSGHVLEATIEAGENGVMRSDLLPQLHGSVKVALVRPPYASEEEKQAVLDFCRSMLGKPYDNIFDMEKAEGEKWYCSSLLYCALKKMQSPPNIRESRRLKRTLVVPDSFLNMEGAEVLYQDQFTYWSSLTGAVPTALGTAAATAALHLLLPHAAPFAAFYLTVGAGNKLQTGRFGITG